MNRTGGQQHTRLRIKRPLAVDVATFSGHLLSLALPLSMIQIFDRVIPAQGMATLAVLAMILIGAAILEAAVRSAAAAIQARTSSEQDLERVGRLLHHTLYARHRLSEEPDPAEIRSLFETSERVRGLDAGDLKGSRFDLPFALVFIGIFALIAPSLVWALLVALALVVLPSVGGPVLEKLQDERFDRTKRLHDFLTQTLAGAESVKGVRAEPFMLRRFEGLSAGTAHLTGIIARLRGRRRARGEVASHAVPVFMAIAGASSVIAGNMSAGALAAAILLSGRAVQPLLRSLASRDMRRGLAPAARRLDTALAAPELTAGDVEAPSLERLDAVNVTVRDGDGNVRLDSVTAELAGGGVLAVTGGSGSGKSLLLRVLAGQIRPDDGEVLWNGEPMETFDRESLARRVRLVKGSPGLPSSTVIDYLTDGDPRQGDAALNVLVQLGVGKELALSPEGLQSRMGASGSGLRPSLEVLLPIARALASKPDLLLFDDANNTLDFASDARVLDALKGLSGRSALVVASARPSYLRLASRTVRLADGKVDTDTFGHEAVA